MKVMMILSYDGSEFNGFQMQSSGLPTVANKLDCILKSLGIRTKIRASGRTDSGVHAIGAVIDIEIPPFWSNLDKLKNIINQNALPNIYIKDIKKVDDDFHSRFCAKRRVYRYVISTKRPSVFMTPYVLFVPEIDEKTIKEAIKYFEGEHDFLFFKKSKGGTKSSVRIVYKAMFYRYKDFYIFYFEANGYLRSQIRMMVSFLLDISNSKLTKQELKEQLSLKKRYSTDIVIPNGLYLAKIKY